MGSNGGESSASELEVLLGAFDDDIFLPLVDAVRLSKPAHKVDTTQQAVAAALAQTDAEFTTLSEFEENVRSGGFSHLVPAEFFDALRSMAGEEQTTGTTPRRGDRGDTSPRRSLSSPKSARADTAAEHYIEKKDIVKFCEALANEMHPDMMSTQSDRFGDAALSDSGIRTRYIAFSAKVDNLTSSATFSNMVVVIIVLYAFITGMDTYEGKTSTIDTALVIAEVICILLFAAEIALRIMAQGETPLRFFFDPIEEEDEYFTEEQSKAFSKRLRSFVVAIQGWNIFDFVIGPCPALPRP